MLIVWVKLSYLAFVLGIVTLLHNGCHFALFIWHVPLLTPANYMAGFMPMEDIFFLQVRIVPFAFSL